LAESANENNASINRSRDFLMESTRSHTVGNLHDSQLEQGGRQQAPKGPFERPDSSIGTQESGINRPVRMIMGRVVPVRELMQMLSGHSRNSLHRTIAEPTNCRSLLQTGAKLITLIPGVSEDTFQVFL
jgi:hypothetical protein